MASSFETFCGGPVWNSSLTWNTTDPDFTPCFHKTVLSWTPSLFLLALVPVEVSHFIISFTVFSRV
jgi:ATP-binding cassette subfamily C (CFTR/MRP) protein 1